MKIGDRIGNERGLWVVVGFAPSEIRTNETRPMQPNLVRQGSLAHLVIASRTPEVSYP